MFECDDCHCISIQEDHLTTCEVSKATVKVGVRGRRPLQSQRVFVSNLACSKIKPSTIGRHRTRAFLCCSNAQSGILWHLLCTSRSNSTHAVSRRTPLYKTNHETSISEHKKQCLRVQRGAVRRMLGALQRRLAAAKADMEDLIARLKQESALTEFLQSKVKDLEGELESERESGQETLRQVGFVNEASHFFGRGLRDWLSINEYREAGCANFDLHRRCVAVARGRRPGLGHISALGVVGLHLNF